VKSIEINGAAGMATGVKVLIAGVIVGAGVGIGYAVHAVTQSSPAASP
jgi:hypothetical protein